MTDTTNLGLPFIEASQAQKHVTHNEALRMLDAAIQVAVLDVTRTAPPGSPAEGARYIVAASPTGAWAGRARAIATWQDGAWAFLVPKNGWCAWSIVDSCLLVFDGTGWRDLRGLALDNAAHIGVNTTASSPNLLSVKSNAALIAAIETAGGGSGDARLQISRESAAKTASVYFSNAYSGRAEFGLVGSDAFRLKVSADGSGWIDALAIDQTSGQVTLPKGLALTGVITPSQLTANQNDYAPAGLAGASIVQLSTDAARSLSGLSGGIEGRIVSLINVGTQMLTLLDDDTASMAANRFALGGDLIVAGKRAVMLRYDATTARWQAIAGRLQPARRSTVQRFLSGSSIYTTPAGVTRLKVRMAGAGAPSAGSGSGATTGIIGGDTTFGASLLVAYAAPLVPSYGYSAGGAGGSVFVGPPAIMTGGGAGNGGNPSNAIPSGYPFGGCGGGSALFGGGGPGASAASIGASGAANTGGGAGGPSGDIGMVSGASGGGGGSLEAIIDTPAASYPYAVGAASIGGVAGASGLAGSPGGSGILIVEEYY